MELTQLIDNFERDGVVIVESLLTPSQTAAAQQAVAWAMTQPPENYKWIRQRTYHYLDAHRIFVELIAHPLVNEFAAAWLGEDYHLIAAQCSRNTRDDPYIADLTTLHQDASFFPDPQHMRPGVPAHRYGFSAMWYMQDTPLEMGPTEFAHGSFHQDSTAEPPAQHALWRRAIPAGSVLLFNHRTWHRGAANHTAHPRDLITNAYARPEVAKVQLTSPRGDGSAVYEPPSAVMQLSPLLQHLLAAHTR